MTELHPPENAPLNLTIKPTVLAIAEMAKQVEDEQPQEIEEPQQSWQEINDIYEACAVALVETASGMTSAIAAAESVAKPDHAPFVKELGILRGGLLKDIETMTSQLLDIKSKHNGKEGVINDGEELMSCFGVFGEYMEFNTKFRAVTTPTILTILENVNSIMSDLEKSETVQTQTAEV